MVCGCPCFVPFVSLYRWKLIVGPVSVTCFEFRFFISDVLLADVIAICIADFLESSLMFMSSLVLSVFYVVDDCLYVPSHVSVYLGYGGRSLYMPSISRFMSCLLGHWGLTMYGCAADIADR